MSAEEGRLYTQVTQAGRAEADLRVVGDAFKTLRAEYGAAWEATDPRDTAGREKLWVATTILTRVEANLRNLVNNGVIAKREIEAVRKAGEPRKRFGVI